MTRSSKPARAADPAASEQDVKQAINAALELFQRRWTLKLLWELRGSPMTFRQLQAACDNVSASVLNLRLSELRDALLVARDEAGAGYALTEQGRSLLKAIGPLLRWAPQWSASVRASNQREAG